MHYIGLQSLEVEWTIPAVHASEACHNRCQLPGSLSDPRYTSTWELLGSLWVTFGLGITTPVFSRWHAWPFELMLKTFR